MDYINYEKRDRKAEVILNRPEKRNALHPDLVRELSNVLKDAAAEESIKVLILKANGPSFCAGADLAYLQQLQSNSYEENLQDSVLLKDFLYQLYKFPKPVIAQVSGHAIAGGAGFVSVCDFVFMAPEAKIGYSEVRIGFIPAIVSPFLIKKLGEGRAKEWLLSGKLYSANEALTAGLITQVVEAASLEQTVSEFAMDLINSNALESMALTKKLLRSFSEDQLVTDLDRAAEFNARARSTESCKRGIQAFLDKQTIKW